MKHIPEEIDGHSESQEIYRLLRNKKIHYHVENIPPSAPALRHIDPVNTSPMKYRC
jgi:hypothetical protein